MKKIILSFVALFAIGSFSNAQMTIYESGTTTDIEGQSVPYPLTVSVNWEQHHMYDFLVNNESAVDEDWVITREIIVEPAGWQSLYCWGTTGAAGFCYNPNNDQYQYSYAEPVPAGGSGTLTTYMWLAQTSGCATYRYHVSADSVNYIGHVDIEVCSVLGIEDASLTMFTISPNPSNESFTVAIDGSKSAALKVTDMLGNIVFEEDMGVQTTVDVSSYNNGVYFVSIEVEGAKPISKKILVQH
ncbi:MAG: T9SS type A sorting domain-containing protein [Crocinitomicaceae bacterium]|nr:T9SS type A sorting domain-containing protein [Crocinitomicaceae bacterium]